MSICYGRNTVGEVVFSFHPSNVRHQFASLASSILEWCMVHTIVDRWSEWKRNVTRKVAVWLIDPPVQKKEMGTPSVMVDLPRSIVQNDSPPEAIIILLSRIWWLYFTSCGNIYQKIQVLWKHKILSFSRLFTSNGDRLWRHAAWKRMWISYFFASKNRTGMVSKGS